MRWLLLCVVICVGIPRPALALTKTYALLIGNNATPADTSEGSLQTLRYADDDAAALFEFFTERGAETHLLSVLDASSQRRFEGAARHAKAPTLQELEKTVRSIATALDADVDAGIESRVIISFSGHGTADANGEPYLALLDAKLTRDLLYRTVLAPLHAGAVHLLIDACHAEAIVRPRDGDGSARVVMIDERDARRFAEQKTLARFPHVGAFIATATNEQAHEWDGYGHGVFTHQVLSGLRGAADVNADDRIEYSELHAFIAAANRDVTDERARLAIIAKPPALDAHAPIVDLRDDAHAATLYGETDALGHLFIEDALGERLVDTHAERGYPVRLVVPANRPLFVHTGGRQAEVTLNRGQRLAFASLNFAPAATRQRGALDSALRRGLFSSAFGPTYYRGFVDRGDDVPVKFTTTATASTDTPRTRARTTSIALLVVSGGLAATLSGAAVGLIINLDAYRRTSFQRPADEARNRMIVAGTIAGISLAGALATAIAGAIIFPRADVELGIAPSVDGAQFVLGGRF